MVACKGMQKPEQKFVIRFDASLSEQNAGGLGVARVSEDTDENREK